MTPPEQPTLLALGQEDTVLLTFDVPRGLHHRLIIDCATKGVKMATVLRQMT